MMEKNIENFPYDIIFYIFKFFIYLDFVNLQKTNKFFHEMVLDFLKLKKKDIRPLGFRHKIPTPAINYKWDKFFYNENNKLFLHIKNRLYRFEDKKIYVFDEYERYTTIKKYKDLFYTTSYNNFIEVYNTDENHLFLNKIICEEEGTIVDFEIVNDKIYFCGKFNSVECYDIQGNFIKNFKTKYCSSKLVIDDEEKLLLVSFDRQNTIGFYETKDFKNTHTYHLKKYGQIKDIKNKNNLYCVSLENGNINVYDRGIFKYFIKTDLTNLTDFLISGNLIYAYNINHKEVKIYYKYKYFNKIVFKKPSISPLNYTLDKSGNLICLYNKLTPLI